MNPVIASASGVGTDDLIRDKGNSKKKLFGHSGEQVWNKNLELFAGING